jgi:hypothetical protein
MEVVDKTGIEPTKQMKIKQADGQKMSVLEEPPRAR